MLTIEIEQDGEPIRVRVVGPRGAISEHKIAGVGPSGALAFIEGGLFFSREARDAVIEDRLAQDRLRSPRASTEAGSATLQSPR